MVFLFVNAAPVSEQGLSPEAELPAAAPDYFTRFVLGTQIGCIFFPGAKEYRVRRAVRFGSRA
jgi:hypothetical protein